MNSTSIVEDGTLRYDRLANERHEIRILTLLPGRWADELQCKLVTQSLDANPLYHALSYAWGHHSTHSSISVDDYVVEVTPSLESALRQIRQEDMALSLWVDKLCINQLDEEEKSEQVALMHRVYRQCSNVLIWLGPAEPPHEAARKHELHRKWSERSMFSETLGSIIEAAQSVFACLPCRKLNTYRRIPEWDEDALEDPFAIIMHFARNQHISGLQCFSRTSRRQRLVFKETALFRSMWFRFRQLLDTPWHSRLWCVQEALLPNNAWVMYGKWRIPLTTIKKGLQNHRRHLFTCCSDVEKLFPSTYAFCPDSLYLTSTPDLDLDVLLRTYRYKACRDPRDMIYGILALLEDDVGLNIDYGLDIAEVYTDAASAIIRKSRGSLRCLTGHGFGSENRRLPSWVRDLSLRPNIAAVQFEMRRLEAYSLYNAAGSLSGTALSQEGQQVQVSGHFVDKIKKVCSALDVPIENVDWKFAFRILMGWHHAAKQAGDKTSLLRPDVYAQAFWRTILSDLIWDPSRCKFRRFTSADVEPYEQWLRQVMIDWLTFRKPTLEDRYVQPLLSATFARSLFVTTRGYLGLCYPTARPGDEVWILRGGNVPFVLRAATEKTVVRRYALVGDCYLHGFMDGKPTESTALQERELLLV